jgi:hypothetical protein
VHVLPTNNRNRPGGIAVELMGGCVFISRALCVSSLTPCRPGNHFPRFRRHCLMCNPFQSPGMRRNVILYRKSSVKPCEHTHFDPVFPYSFLTIARLSAKWCDTIVQDVKRSDDGILNAVLCFCVDHGELQSDRKVNASDSSRGYQKKHREPCC